MAAAYLLGREELSTNPCRKAGYDSRVIASRMLHQFKAFGPGGLRIYRCRLCGLWHHGHPPRRKRKY